MAIELTPHDILIRPFITEKAMAHVKNSLYTFEVDSRANKYLIKNAIEKLYNVQVSSVHVMNVMGKPKRYGKSEGYSRSYKKAIVQLKQGFKIQELEGLV